MCWPETVPAIAVPIEAEDIAAAVPARPTMLPCRCCCADLAMAIVRLPLDEDEAESRAPRLV